MKIKALVVEDRISLNKSITSMLLREGYAAFNATDVEDAKDIFLKEKPHIVLLDIMLPGGSGFDLIYFFRKHNDSRILMLTALDDEQSKRVSYENGADDYITKPFDLYELVYKLGAIKRQIISSLREYQVGDIVFDTDSNRISCGEKSFFIQPSQIKLLRCLYERYEEDSYLDKSEACGLNCEGVDESQRLQTLAARLRKSLIDVGSKDVFIETIYGKGYKLYVKNPGKRNE